MGRCIINVMKRRGVIISIVLVILILFGALLYFAFRGEKEAMPESEIVNVTGVEAGWRFVEHPVFNITFQVPEAWEITVFEDGKGQAKATFLAEGIAAELRIYERPNLFGITADQLMQSEPNKFQGVERDGRVGVGYVTKAGREVPGPTEEGGLIEDSYILNNQFFIGEKILEVNCQIIGQAYRTLIPTCERMVGEVHFQE